jgi:hypothetical protein
MIQQSNGAISICAIKESNDSSMYLFDPLRSRQPYDSIYDMTFTW